MSQTVHSATISRAVETYAAKVGDVTIARSDRAMILQEVNAGKTYAPVVYFPLDDVVPGVLEPSDHTTHCPIKGDAGYFTVKAGGATLENAAWTYPDPMQEVAAVEGHVAFYPDRVTVGPVA